MVYACGHSFRVSVRDAGAFAELARPYNRGFTSLLPFLYLPLMPLSAYFALMVTRSLSRAEKAFP